MSLDDRASGLDTKRRGQVSALPTKEECENSLFLKIPNIMLNLGYRS